jgi:hypothetical protein
VVARRERNLAEATLMAPQWNSGGGAVGLAMRTRSTACALLLLGWLPAFAAKQRREDKGEGTDRGRWIARRAVRTTLVQREWRRGTGRAVALSCLGARAASGRATLGRREPRDAASGPGRQGRRGAGAARAQTQATSQRGSVPAQPFYPRTL